MTAEILTIVLVAFLAGMGIGSGLIAWKLSRRKQQVTMLPGSGLMFAESKKSFWSDWFHGVSTEMAGAIVTAVLFTIILGGAEQQRVIDEQKTQLIIQMGSPNNEAAIEAIRQLRLHGWLEDGSLNYKHFESASLSNTNLEGADLEGAILYNADLRGASLYRANLKFVNLSNSSNRQMNLSGIYTYIISPARFDTDTVLPDGRNWTPETDMSKFIDPNHPDFWETGWVKEERE